MALLQCMKTITSRMQETKKIEFVKQLRNILPQDYLNTLTDSGDSCILAVAKRITLGSLVESNKECTERSSQPLASIFAAQKGSDRWYQRWEERNAVMPKPIQGDYQLESETVYAEALAEICAALKDIELKPENLSTWTTVLQQPCASLPAITGLKEYQDISLFDYAHISAAVAACLNEYMMEQGIDESSIQQDSFQKEPAFLLYSCGFSGIQKFIYDVTSKKALRSLRGRSFLLELFMEHLVDELVSMCGVSRLNVIYSGGGRSYILLPNTAQARTAIDSLKKTVNQFLIGNFADALFMTSGWVECCGNELMNHPEEEVPYQKVFTRLQMELEKNKVQKYSAAEIRLMNAGHQDQERECVVCGSGARYLDENNFCAWCSSFISLSDHLMVDDAQQEIPVLAVLGHYEKDKSVLLPRGDGPCHAVFMEAQELKKQKDAGNVIRLYALNTLKAHQPDAVLITVNNYSFGKMVEDFWEEDDTFKKIGVFRADVDNLGAIFSSAMKTERPASLCRTASLSRQISYFFKNYLFNVLVGDGDTSKKRIAVIYAGGDDLFLIGEWQDVLNAAVQTASAFENYSCSALTLSGGLALFGPKYPIARAAEETAVLLDIAKETDSKNSLCIFEKNRNHCYTWPDFVKEVRDEKLTSILGFFKEEVDSSQQALGNNFLYNMLELLQRRENRINIARFAYLLARMEPKRNSSDNSKRKYQEFSAKMYEWAQDREDTRQLMTAMLIYLYMERGKGTDE